MKKPPAAPPSPATKIIKKNFSRFSVPGDITNPHCFLFMLLCREYHFFNVIRFVMEGQKYVSKGVRLVVCLLTPAIAGKHSEKLMGQAAFFAKQ